MTPYKSDKVATINFPNTRSNFATSERNQNVGALFEGYLKFPSFNNYLCVTSNDGSKLYVDNELVIYNDHINKDDTNCATVHKSGIHKVSVEFFERKGSATLVLEWAQSKFDTLKVVPPSAWVNMSM